MLTHECFDLTPFAGMQAHTIEYDFSQYGTGPQLAGVVTGSGAGPVVPFTATFGPALRMQMGANPGTATYTGPAINSNFVAAAIIDVTDMSYGGSGSPLWGIGWYNSALTYYSELFRDNTGVSLTTQNGSSGLREIHKAAKGDNLGLRYAKCGLYMDFVNNRVTAHMGYSMMQTTTNMPLGQDLSFKVRALTTASQQNFDVYIRKIKLTLIP
ncbi:hypothetical protein SEA_BRUHMOMENT_37 [Arthrobacter phage BruhMoment]|nr:hypothetical protein SEA_BRUHMOMENT_37 [Arthrobacter phage BruhMoment]